MSRPTPLSPQSVSPRSALPDLAVGALPPASAGVVGLWILDLSATYLVTVVVGYCLLAVLILAKAPDRFPGPGLGWANRITLFRAAFVLPVAALLVTPGSARGSVGWFAVALSVVALALDGVDGQVARRTRSATPFGARFDMELDAFLILALSALLWTSTPLGAWVLGIGLIRYLFVASGWIWPALEADLPPCLRRKAVCVVQVAALLVALTPGVSLGFARGAAATALVLLVYSFAVDVHWLWFHARRERLTAGR